jgi:type I restriction enzyme, S subunit
MTKGWSDVMLGDVLTRVKRPVKLEDDKLYRTLGVRWYGAGCFTKDAQPGSKIAASTLYGVEADDVVFSRLFAWKGSFGVVGETEASAVASNEFPTYRPNDDLDPAFFQAWASRASVWALAADASTGTTSNSRNRLSEEAFLELPISLPPLAEQERIVVAVSAARRYFEAAAREAAALFDLLAATREHLLLTSADWTTLPPDWTLSTLGAVADVRSGITKGRKTTDPVRALRFIRAANVQDGFLELSAIKAIEVTEKEAERFRLQDGDVLLIEGGNAEHLGRGWVWNAPIEECLHQNHVFRARPHREVIDPRFLAYAIAASPARAYCLECAKRTTNLASINKSQISLLPVPVPPVATQRTIVEQLDAIRSNGVAAQRLSETMGAMTKVIIEELVTGERALRAPEPAALV